MTDKKSASILFDNAGKAEVLPDEVAENRRLRKQLAWYRREDKDRGQVGAVFFTLLAGLLYISALFFVSIWAWAGVHAEISLMSGWWDAMRLQLLMYSLTTMLAVISGIFILERCSAPIREELAEAREIGKRMYRGAVEGGKAAAKEDL